jgi:hypothetical protein
MTKEYKEVIHNAATGEVTERPYTAAEIAEAKADEIKAVERVATMQKAETNKAAAVGKLFALGLTAEDLKALGF